MTYKTYDPFAAAMGDTLRMTYATDTANATLDRWTRMAEQSLSAVRDDQDDDHEPLFRDQPDYSANMVAPRLSAAMISEAWLEGDDAERDEIDFNIEEATRAQNDRQNHGVYGWWDVR